MPSVKNPNVPNKLRRVASRSKVQKKAAKGASKSKAATLFPTSGPKAPLSKKKARKVEKAQAHARKRALEEMMAQEGEVQMTDAPKTTPKTSKPQAEANGEKMELDNFSY